MTHPALAAFLSILSMPLVGWATPDTVATATAPTHALTVEVDGLRNTDGDVVVCLWRATDPGFPHCATGEPLQVLIGSAGRPVVDFEGLPSGKYAVTMFHDEGSLGHPRTNLVGMHRSGVGLSNDAALGVFSRATFAKGVVSVSEDTSIKVGVQYPF